MSESTFVTKCPCIQCSPFPIGIISRKNSWINSNLFSHLALFRLTFLFGKKAEELKKFEHPLAGKSPRNSLDLGTTSRFMSGVSDAGVTPVVLRAWTMHGCDFFRGPNSCARPPCPVLSRSVHTSRCSWTDVATLTPPTQALIAARSAAADKFSPCRSMTTDQQTDRPTANGSCSSRRQASH